MMTRNEMIEHLQAQVCRVVFKKINGEERNMECTLMENVLPKATKDPLSQKKVRAVNEAVIVAWDVNKDDFRSFRVENVVSFS
jgi:Na+-translocating ferredoxin:NAD+ oxidoreductase RnfG subunit